MNDDSITTEAISRDQLFVNNLVNKYGDAAIDVVQLLLDEAIEQHTIHRIKHWHMIKKMIA